MKILVADTDAPARLLISRSIGNQHELLCVDDGEQALAVLKGADAPQLAILDADLTGISGLGVCRILRQELGPEARYLVLTSDPHSHPDPAEAFIAGADDFILKPLDAAFVQARLRIASRILELQDRCARALDPDSDRDSLTALWSRRVILEFMNAQFARSARDGISMSLLLGDMDNFYSANAKHGQAACDLILRDTAKRISAALRPYDSVGRYGGEEFLIICPDCTLSNAQLVAERLRCLVADEPFNIAGKLIHAAISFGVATTAETGALDADSLLRSADYALLAAKEHGRNRVELAKRIVRQRPSHPRFAPQARARELVQ